MPVALYAISAVYFAGVMVRLMLTLTPVVCMLSAVAFSSVFEHYMGDDTKREKPPAEDSSDEDDKRNSGNLYDKVKTGRNDRRNVHQIRKLSLTVQTAAVWIHHLHVCQLPSLPTSLACQFWVNCDSAAAVDAVLII